MLQLWWVADISLEGQVHPQVICVGCVTDKLVQGNVFDFLLTVHLSIFISVINQLDAQNFCFTKRLFHASTCFEHMCSSSHHHTYGCDDTRGCVMKFSPPDDEHMCSKHVEA